MAASVTEREIMRRWDEGHSKEKIARDTGFTSMMVDRVVGWCSTDEPRLERKAAAKGSQALLAALQAAA